MIRRPPNVFFFFFFFFFLSTYGADEKVRRAAGSRGELLTPIVKGWCTEIGNEVAGLGVQVHGGMGYIEETGAAQYLRDVRITTIYEGTTGIQSNDLIGRKLGRDRGAAMGALIGDMERELRAIAATDASVEATRKAALEAVAALKNAPPALLGTLASRPHAAMAGSGAVPEPWGALALGRVPAKTAAGPAGKTPRPPRQVYPGHI